MRRACPHRRIEGSDRVSMANAARANGREGTWGEGDHARRVSKANGARANGARANGLLAIREQSKQGEGVHGQGEGLCGARVRGCAWPG
jgi:hypothetical protein